MITSRTLTLETLKAKRACAEQLRLFESMFGQSVEVTEALCVEVSAKFDFAWAAQRLLSLDALAEYERVTAPAWAEYKRVTAPAWAEYKRVRASALAEYERVRASAFARAYIGDAR